MDFKTQFMTGILCGICGVYLFIYGYKTVVLRKEALIFPVQFGIWLNRILKGKEAAETFKNQQLKPKYLLYNGISYLIIGTISLVLGILLLTSL